MKKKKRKLLHKYSNKRKILNTVGFLTTLKKRGVYSDNLCFFFYLLKVYIKMHLCSISIHEFIKIKETIMIVSSSSFLERKKNIRNKRNAFFMYLYLINYMQVVQLKFFL